MAQSRDERFAGFAARRGGGGVAVLRRFRWVAYHQYGPNRVLVQLNRLESIISFDEDLWRRGLDLYARRPDRSWSLHDLPMTQNAAGRLALAG